MDCSKHNFAIQILQQGNRLAKRHLPHSDPCFFEPSDFSVVLFSASGKLIHAKFESDFNYVIVNDEFSLEPDDYICLIDPVWNVTAETDASFQQILCNIFSPRPSSLKFCGATSSI